MEDSTKILQKAILGRFSKIIWTHKIHEIQADMLFKKAKCIQRHICWFTVLTTGGAVTSMLSLLSNIIPGEYVTTIAGSLTTILAASLSYFTLRYGDGQIEKKANENKSYAAKVHNLRNRYESLLADIKSHLLTDTEIINRRNQLETEENILYSGFVPLTTKKAVAAADIALKIKKDSTTEEEEINLLVPEYLR